MASLARILRRHEGLRGRLVAGQVRSRALGIAKPYFVYEPPHLDRLDDLPLLLLFRGHQREWVNMSEDSSRRHSTAIEDLDRRIHSGSVPPVIALLPGLSSSNNHVPSLGIDMVGSWSNEVRGLGTGRFWSYLTGELIPAVERRYSAHLGSRRLAAGFSLGGYTVSLLATRMPGWLSHAAIYDGTFMWPDHSDPRVDGSSAFSDRIWMRASIFDAAFGRPRDREALREWNPTEILVEAPAEKLERIRRTQFFVSSAPNDGRFGNVDRATMFVELLRERAMPLGFEEVVFDRDAAHSWHWTDRFLLRFLEAAMGTPAG